MRPGEIIHSRSIAAVSPGITATFSASKGRRRKGEPTRVFQFLYLGVTTLEEPQDGVALVEIAAGGRYRGALETALERLKIHQCKKPRSSCQDCQAVAVVERALGESNGH